MKYSIEIKIPSRTTKGDWHTVTISGNKIKCDCVASLYKEPICWHKTEALRLLQKYFQKKIE